MTVVEVVAEVVVDVDADGVDVAIGLHTPQHFPVSTTYSSLSVHVSSAHSFSMITCWACPFFSTHLWVVHGSDCHDSPTYPA